MESLQNNGFTFPNVNSTTSGSEMLTNSIKRVNRADFELAESCFEKTETSNDNKWLCMAHNPWSLVCLKFNRFAVSLTLINQSYFHIQRVLMYMLARESKQIGFWEIDKYSVVFIIATAIS